MPDRHLVLTPEALTMIDTVARTGSFAAAARELGKVPSALTYNVRQLEDALDVLLFDRSSRQARFTAAGRELLDEGRRLLAEAQAVANRVRRVATGWETQLTVAVDDVISQTTLFELCEAFYALNPQGTVGSAAGGPGTRLRLRTEVMAGTWEALTSGQADLAIGIGMNAPPPPGVAVEPLGEMEFVFVHAPQHPLARHDGPVSDTELLRHRAIAVADTAHRLSPMTVNLLPGQEVLTVSTMRDKIAALLRCMGCGYAPETLVREHVAAGRLRIGMSVRARQTARLGYAWRSDAARKGRREVTGLALAWWLEQLKHPATRQSLLDRHGPAMH